jgi:hypothetical protein
MRRGSSCVAGLVVIVVLVVVVVYASRQMNPGTTSPAFNGSNIGGLSSALGKPKPQTSTFQGCPPSGDGGDPILNTLKNRIDEGAWQPTTVAALLALTWPKSIEQQPRARWSAQDARTVAAHEGTPVQVDGYLVAAKKMSPESCNCHSVTNVDFHLWLVDDPNKGREQAVVVEVSPRVRAVHSAWTLSRMSQLASRRDKVRISGWLMMDPEHPDQIGKTRGTIWEIHPIMQIETMSGGAWHPLDNGTTGVSSAPAVAQTAPVVTPVDTATVPAAGNAQVQDNKSVQITNINFDGQKGSSEPDEYVEMTNQGTQPVDMTDWLLQDSGGRNFYKWESYVLQPGASIRVYTNEDHPESGGFSFQSARAIWGNSGDVAELYDSDQQLVSRYGYGNKK